MFFRVVLNAASGSKLWSWFYLSPYDARSLINPEMPPTLEVWSEEEEEEDVVVVEEVEEEVEFNEIQKLFTSGCKGEKSASERRPLLPPTLYPFTLMHTHTLPPLSPLLLFSFSPPTRASSIGPACPTRTGGPGDNWE